MKSRLTGKDPDAGKDREQEEKAATEDEMIGWHHRHDGHAFEQALGDGEGQGSLARSSPWGCKESDVAEQPSTSNTDATDGHGRPLTAVMAPTSSFG